MEFLEVTINDKKYEYVASINYESKSFVALASDSEITINEYAIIDGKLFLYPISDELFSKVSEVMKLHDTI